ncbi:hypothetical protein GGI13_003607 [Coemansia sp. RSA 455]|nr:hypothetical protein GGI13_003607 [Coemansia sp. RSA 455]
MSSTTNNNSHRYVHALNELDDVNISRIRPLIPPQILMEDLPLTERAAATIVKGRKAAEAIIQGTDDRLLVVVGPCSIHNPAAALEYADSLRVYADAAAEDLCIVMRVYFEKPRTTVGWKGLINDPDLNNNYAINKGLRKARTLLLDISEKGLPAGCELLDTISPQYIGDLISWGAIGARTTESQVHRELSSGMSVPIGFKNGTDGNVKIAIDAIKSAESPHCFLSVTKQGLSAIVETQGNKHCHIILRGGVDGPNFEESYVENYTQQLLKAGVNPRLMIDCSHGNSSKDFRKQPIVSDSVAHQLSATETGKYISGVMIESNLVEGNQNIPSDGDLSKLVYGMSVTDACVNWDDTVKMLDNLREGVRNRRRRAAALSNASDFEAKFRTLLTKLDVVEGEETWGQIDTALKGLTSLVQAGATKFETFVPTMKQAIKYVNSAVISERTRLSGTALALVEEMAKQMETRFTPICDMVFPSAMKTCGRANKVFVTRGVNSLTTVITYSHIPEQTPRICDAASTDPNKTVRSSAAKLLMAIVSCCTVPELTPHLAVVESAIASGVVDANPDARTTARQTYEIYIKRFGNRVEQFHAGLSATAKKYLKIGAATGNGASQTATAATQRLPLRDRISAQRANGKPAIAATAAGAPTNAQQADALSSSAPAASRPKPVRPVARNPPLAVNKGGAGAVAQVALSLTSSEVKAPEVQPPLATSDPATTTASNGVESLLISTEEPATTDKPPQDSARPSASPTATAHESRAPSPDAKVESESEAAAPASEPSHPTATASPAATADTAESVAVEEAPQAVAVVEKKKPRRVAVAPQAVVKRPASRAQRGPGLQFSSLGSGGGAGSGSRAANKKGGASASSRGPHAVRPQSRNIVSSRMEEALRGRPKSRFGAGGGAQRPQAVKATSPSDSADRLDRMTLRSSSRLSNSLPFPTVEPVAAPASGPGYLRATAASAKRGTDAPVSATSTAASRGTKRRKQDAASTTDDLVSAESAPKSAKVGARRRSATK